MHKSFFLIKYKSFYACVPPLCISVETDFDWFPVHRRACDFPSFSFSAAFRSCNTSALPMFGSRSLWIEFFDVEKYKFIIARRRRVMAKTRKIIVARVWGDVLQFTLIQKKGNTFTCKNDGTERKKCCFAWCCFTKQN